MFLGRIPNYASALDAPAYPKDNPSRGKSRKSSRKGLAMSRSWFRLRRPHKVRRQAERASRLQNALAVGNWLYEQVRLIEHNWRTEIIEGLIPYDANEDRSILAFYRQWLEPTQRCLSEIRQLRSMGVEVAGSREFEEYCAEAPCILKGDSPFFEDASQAGLWAARTSQSRESIRPVEVDQAGRIFELSGARFHMPGLEPAAVLEALEDERAGRTRSLTDIIASRDEHGLRSSTHPEG
jgi:hypothetical protein